LTPDSSAFLHVGRETVTVIIGVPSVQAKIRPRKAVFAVLNAFDSLLQDI
jgi:hypothetical protein